MLKYIYSIPTSDITSEEFSVKLDGIPTKVPIQLCEIIFTEENIKKALNSIDNSSAAGPDGVPPQILKCGGKFISNALCDIGMNTMDENIPDILKMMWISPTWKGGPRCDPAEYRPLALTSHILKTIERVISAEIVKHIWMRKN